MIFSVYLLELRKLFSYRVDFWVHFLAGPSIHLFVAYFIWKTIFEFKNIDQMGGYTFQSMMLYYLVIAFINNGTHPQRNDSISHEIYEGTLTRYLIYPLSFFGYKFSQQLAHLSLTLGQLFIVLAGASLFLNIHLSFTFSQIILFLLFVFISMTLSFLIGSILDLIAFWADQVWSLLILFQFSVTFLGGGALPLSIFPEWAQEILYYLPFAAILSIPANIFVGIPPGIDLFHSFFISLSWILFLMVIQNALWKKGLRHYSGVGI